MASKMRNDRLNLPPLELKCMKALWALGGGTVHDVRARLLSERAFAYTTVLTLMDRLARKGILEREKRGRAYRYRPLIAEERIRHQAIERFVGAYFQGSREQLRLYLETGVARETRQDAPKPAPAARVPGTALRSSSERPIDPTLL